MATRGNRPKDPASTKGGVRGTHGLGDEPREPHAHAVAVQGGTASPTGGTPKGGIAKQHRGNEIPGASTVDESTGEEREFELSNAMAELETADERAERRERDARAALADDEEEREERIERGLETVKTDGPGPKDKGKGSASKKQVQEHGLDLKH